MNRKEAQKQLDSMEPIETKEYNGWTILLYSKTQVEILLDVIYQEPKEKRSRKNKLIPEGVLGRFFT